VIGIYNASALVSMAGLCFAVATCALAIAAELELAIPCLIAAGVCDLFDGVVARREKRDAHAQAFGAELDSIIDMASFGLAPVVLGFAAGLSGPFAWISALAYACAAAQRLANFNTTGLTEDETGAKYYTGLPVPYAALIFPLVLTIFRVLEVEAATWLAASYLATAVAFVTRVPIRKPGGRAYAVFPALAVFVSGYWIFEHLGGI